MTHLKPTNPAVRMTHTTLLALTVGLGCSGFASMLQAQSSTDSVQEYDVDPQTGFRMERYRAPVPASIPGGQVLTTADVQHLLAQRASGNDNTVFIDVYPPRGMGPDPIDGSWIITEEHQTIDGSIWLPEVGRGYLEPGHEDYFRRNLVTATQGDTSLPVLFFCTADCWQSWNAAVRAIQWGYTQVLWYPVGTDGWQEAGESLVDVQPVNYLGASFPDEAAVELVQADGQAVPIGHVQFASDDGEHAAIKVTVEGEAFTDQFLSMRPFNCITHDVEWFCHLPYDYPLNNVVTQDDLTDLEYQLLFILKSPTEFGIDAWNGVYYRLSPDDNGGWTGHLLQGDLNVLSSPPADGERPIALTEFIDDEADRRRFPTLRIKPR